jgi:peptide/nickel transport system ATP-binding protein
VTAGSILRRRVGTVQAVDGVSFDVRSGETLALVGESGCGKTTTLTEILELTPPERGSVEVLGRDVGGLSRRDRTALRRDVQVVFQDPIASLDPRMPVHDIIAEPLSTHRVPPEEIRRRVPELLRLVGLRPEHAGRYPAEFSGGQRQRIGIARALCVEPDLIVADEPVSALDVSVQAQVLNLLGRLQKELGLTYLVIAHDLAVVRHVSDRIGVMYLGGIVEEAPSQALYDDPQHPYTRALLSAVPVPDPELEDRRERILLTGDLPSPAAPPPGCRFHTRCPWRQPTRCDDERPLLRVVDGAADGHRVACHFAEDIRSGVLQPHRVEAVAADDVLGAVTAPELPGSVTEILGR